MTVHLSPRQLQVLREIADGHSIKTAAHATGVSQHTVIWHRREMYRLLGARNAAHAVAIGYQRGLL